MLMYSHLILYASIVFYVWDLIRLPLLLYVYIIKTKGVKLRPNCVSC